MFQALRGGPLPALVFAAALYMFIFPVDAKESSASVKDAEQYIAAGDLKAAVIELKNAVLGSPQDPAIRVRLADVYLRLEDFRSAEHEARAARELSGNEADYLPVLADSLLRQQKFKDIIDLIEPSDRAPVLESKVRTAIGSAAAGLGYGEKGRGDAARRDPARSERAEAKDPTRAILEQDEPQCGRRGHRQRNRCPLEISRTVAS